MHIDMSDGSDSTVYGSTCVATGENPTTVSYEDLMALAVEMDACKEPRHVTVDDVKQAQLDWETNFGEGINRRIGRIITGGDLV